MVKVCAVHEKRQLGINISAKVLVGPPKTGTKEEEILPATERDLQEEA